MGAIGACCDCEECSICGESRPTSISFDSLPGLPDGITWPLTFDAANCRLTFGSRCVVDSNGWGLKLDFNCLTAWPATNASDSIQIGDSAGACLCAGAKPVVLWFGESQFQTRSRVWVTYFWRYEGTITRNLFGPPGSIIVTLKITYGTATSRTEIQGARNRLKRIDTVCQVIYGDSAIAVVSDIGPWVEAPAIDLPAPRQCGELDASGCILLTGVIVTFSGGGGSGGYGIADLGVNGEIISITIVDGGSGYTSNPTVNVSVSPDPILGWPAILFATIENGKVTSVIISSGGFAYSGAEPGDTCETIQTVAGTYALNCESDINVYYTTVKPIIRCRRSDFCSYYDERGTRYGLQNYNSVGSAFGFQKVWRATVNCSELGDVTLELDGDAGPLQVQGTWIYPSLSDGCAEPPDWYYDYDYPETLGATLS